MTGGTWLDSTGLSGTWTAEQVDNTQKNCTQAQAANCPALKSVLTPSELQVCVGLWSMCDGFGGRTGNPLQTCVANVGGACDGFGGMTVDQGQTCIALVTDCGGFAGMTLPQIQTCVSVRTSCDRFGGMTPPSIQTCVANVGGACEGFGPKSQSQLQACVANVGGACEGFGPPPHAETISPTALNPWTLECGSDGYSGFLFDHVRCKDNIEVTTDATGASARAASGPIVLSHVIGVVPANDIFVGRLAVLNPSAKSYLAKFVRTGHELTLHLKFDVTMLRNGRSIGSRTFDEAVKAKVAPRP
jgi:hypothetical protein